MKAPIFLFVSILVGSMFLGIDFGHAVGYEIGPSGGTGGTEFTDVSQVPEDSRVIEVDISSGLYIDSVQMVHEMPSGTRLELEEHGGTGGAPSTFYLEPNEHITGLGGRYGIYVDSMWIETNLRSSPIYGGSGGDADYYFAAPDGYEIVGFNGRSGSYVDAIGVVLRKL